METIKQFKYKNMIKNNLLIHTLLTSFMIWGTSVSAEFSLDMSVGVRIDEMKWSIAGDVMGGNPNVLSELTWTDVTSKTAKTELTFVADNGFYFSGMLTFADITDGNMQDSDYMGNNRTVEFSRSSSTTSGDDLLDVSVAIGYQIHIWDEQTILTPMIGLSRHEQNFRMTNGVQEINLRSDFTGPFAGLNSSYQAVWEGVWIGLDISHRVGKRLSLFGDVEYHRVDYTAEADWNLRSDFAHPVSFRHTANGDGFVFKLGGRYHFTKQFALDLHTTWQFWETDVGIDQTFFSNETTGVTRFNGAEWNSAAIMIGIRYTFD